MIQYILYYVANAFTIKLLGQKKTTATVRNGATIVRYYSYFMSCIVHSAHTSPLLVWLKTLTSSKVLVGRSKVRVAWNASSPGLSTVRSNSTVEVNPATMELRLVRWRSEALQGNNYHAMIINFTDNTVGVCMIINYNSWYYVYT